MVDKREKKNLWFLSKSQLHQKRLQFSVKMFHVEYKLFNVIIFWFLQCWFLLFTNWQIVFKIKTVVSNFQAFFFSSESKFVVFLHSTLWSIPAKSLYPFVTQFQDGNIGCANINNFLDSQSLNLDWRPYVPIFSLFGLQWHKTHFLTRFLSIVSIQKWNW